MKQLCGCGIYCVQDRGLAASAALSSQSYRKTRGRFAFLCAALLLCVLVCVSGMNLQAAAVAHPHSSAGGQVNSAIWLLLGIGLAAWLGIWRLAVKTREPQRAAADSRIPEPLRLDDLATSEEQPAMTITISVSEQLRDRAAARGLPVEAYVNQIFGEAAQKPALCR